MLTFDLFYGSQICISIDVYGGEGGGKVAKSFPCSSPEPFVFSSPEPKAQGELL